MSVCEAIAEPAVDSLEDRCEELRSLQRSREQVIKTKVAVNNRMTHLLAQSLGYNSFASEEERTKIWKEATKLAKGIVDEHKAMKRYLARRERHPEERHEEFKMNYLLHPMAQLVAHTFIPDVENCDAVKKFFEQPMVAIARTLPVHTWIQEPEQRGMSEMGLAILIGETGNLSNYPNPGKLWKRMGCAPHSKGGKTRMCSTWRVKCGLTSEEWSEIGYSPRRRKVAFMIGENIVKANKKGSGNVYRDRYDAAKELFQEKHPDAPKGHCHKHGMLLATKLLLKNLWIEWHRVVG